MCLIRQYWYLALVFGTPVGQNAYSPNRIIHITLIIVMKLDGTAQSGVLVSLAERFALPVHAIGIGEGIEDLRPFAARDFARSLTGLQHIDENTGTD
jgi:fused signal recognition particle receptor